MLERLDRFAAARNYRPKWAWFLFYGLVYASIWAFASTLMFVFIFIHAWMGGARGVAIIMQEYRDLCTGLLDGLIDLLKS